MICWFRWFCISLMQINPLVSYELVSHCDFTVYLTKKNNTLQISIRWQVIPSTVPRLSDLIYSWLPAPTNLLQFPKRSFILPHPVELAGTIRNLKCQRRCAKVTQSNVHFLHLSQRQRELLLRMYAFRPTNLANSPALAHSRTHNLLFTIADRHSHTSVCHHWLWKCFFFFCPFL